MIETVTRLETDLNQLVYLVDIARDPLHSIQFLAFRFLVSESYTSSINHCVAQWGGTLIKKHIFKKKKLQLTVNLDYF